MWRVFTRNFSFSRLLSGFVTRRARAQLPHPTPAESSQKKKNNKERRRRTPEIPRDQTSGARRKEAKCHTFILLRFLYYPRYSHRPQTDEAPQETQQRGVYPAFGTRPAARNPRSASRQEGTHPAAGDLPPRQRDGRAPTGRQPGPAPPPPRLPPPAGAGGPPAEECPEVPPQRRYPHRGGPHHRPPARPHPSVHHTSPIN